MRTRVLLFGACLASWVSAPGAQIMKPATPAITSREYAGIYISTPEEDYFTPCGIVGAGDEWSLSFRANDRQAPFLKKVSAIRGYQPLTHFVRVRGRLGPPGRYNVGFQTRQLEVDSVLDVQETLQPCAGFGAAAAWAKIRARFSNLKGVALSTDAQLAALMDIDGRIDLWSTATGARVRQLGPVTKGYVNAASYGPMVFSNDGGLVAAGGNGGVVQVWRTGDGKRIFSLPLKDSAAVAAERAKIPPRADAPGWTPPPPSNSYTPARQIVFNKRGTMLATTNLFSTIVWSMKTGKKLAEFDRGNDFMGKVFFVGDAGLLSTAGGGRFMLRSYLEGTPVSRPGTRARATERMEISPDGHSFAINSGGDSVFLWSIANGPGPVLPVPPFVTGVIAFSPDGKIIATAGGMYGLYLWDTRTGAPIKAFHNFPGPLSGAWFTADSKAIVTVSTFDDRFRVVYIDSTARPASQPLFDDSLTSRLPLGPQPTTAPRTIGGIVTGPDKRAVGGADVTISNGDMPDSVIARATTSPGGYFSFNGIRFRHVLIRVRKPGFAPQELYIHVNRWENDGPWGIELRRDKNEHESLIADPKIH
jgi:WD40 repeat protein